MIRFQCKHKWFVRIINLIAISIVDISTWNEGKLLSRDLMGFICETRT